MVRLILIVSVVIGQTISYSQNVVIDNPLQSYLDKWSEDVVLENAGISFLAYDLNKSSILADKNSKMCLVPASTMKLITTATALEVLGYGYRFRTKLEYSGQIDSAGTLHGNIYIRGGGDPSLGSKYYSNYNEDFLNQWVNAIKEEGIKKIDGGIVGDASIYGENVIPANWSWGDIGNYYGAPANGLTIYDNMVKLQFKSGDKEGDSTWVACMDPYVPEMRVYNKVKAASANKDNAYIYGSIYDPNRIAEGSIHKGEEAFEVKASVHDPAYLTAFELECALIDGGVPCDYSATTVRRQKFDGAYNDTIKKQGIHTLVGASVGNLCYFVNQYSVNLFAEHLFKGIGVRVYGDGSGWSSEKAVIKSWNGKGVNMSGLSMDDGSGLSRSNAVSARHLVRVLKYMGGSSNEDAFKKTLSIAGKSGTLAGIGRGTRAQGNLIGKSGSMTRVRSYAGYVKTASGREVAFAVIVNNYNCTGYQMKKRLESLMVYLANYNG